MYWEVQEYSMSSFLASSEGHLAGHAMEEGVRKMRAVGQMTLLCSKAISLQG